MSDGVIAPIPKRDKFALSGALAPLERTAGSLRYALNEYTGEGYQDEQIAKAIEKLWTAWNDVRKELVRMT